MILQNNQQKLWQRDLGSTQLTFCYETCLLEQASIAGYDFMECLPPYLPKICYRLDTCNDCKHMPKQFEKEEISVQNLVCVTTEKYRPRHNSKNQAVGYLETSRVHIVATRKSSDGYT